MGADRSTRTRAFLPPLAIAALMLLADVAPGSLFGVSRDWLFDTYQRVWPQSRNTPHTVVVDIDDESIRRLGQWPWPRDVLARLIAAAGQARAIGIDILLTEPYRFSPDRLLQHEPVAPALRQALLALPRSDDVLAETLRPLPAVLAMTAGRPVGGRTAEAGATTPVREKGEDARASLPQAASVNWPLPELARAAHGLGLVSLPQETQEATRSLPTVVDVGGSLVPEFCLELLRVAFGGDAIVLSEGYNAIWSVSVGPATIWTDASGGVHPRFAAKMPQTIPAYRLLDGMPQPIALHGQIAMLGVSATGVGGSFNTPMHRMESGAAIRADRKYSCG